LSLVLDASVAAAWCFEDETTPQTERIALAIEQDRAFVPALFPFEIANVLLAAERRKRISRADVDRQLELFSNMPLLIDMETMGRVWDETLTLARAEKLTVYDAAYLELARRTGSALATLDGELAAAARRCGVVVNP
jgi:predicted nucleic acid-binding protein